LAAGDPEHGTMGVVDVSPAALKVGTIAVTLQRPCKISGTLVCDQLVAAGKPIGWTNVYISKSGQRLASCSSVTGKYEFLAPPGEYSLYAYGSDFAHTTMNLTVSSGQAELGPPAINLTASRLLQLQGKPAPELQNVIAWKGRPVKFADLRGKVVLLDFWGYWCGSCVQAMPTLIELHKKFADKGLAIVAVHLDMAGEIDTPEKLDQKIAIFKKDQWKGEDLPFPVALTCGKFITNPDGSQIRAGAASEYGILSYPTTVLIDRKGNVVGRFEARGIEEATSEIEKLLKTKE
ncbi:MAG TPA: TlpA disulfide reductase family protein, partial [Tepidisphaeraceae bacterium]|nr:TlpA disulfide reductase family protein [Tepidisphaeraceae bacterium]